MEVTLNIGLARTGNSNIGVGTVLREIEQSGFTLRQHSIQHSDTEITVVAQVTARYSFTPVAFRLAHLAESLEQDCIAVYHPATGHGYLAGPRAAAWGVFNPDYFLQLDGTRLSADALPRAA